MYRLNIDFNSLLPYVIDAFTQVYGDEYHSIISKKINNTFIASYHDVEGLNDYISYIKNCKSREFAIEFLDKIGIDVEKYKKNNYTEPLDNNIGKILEPLIDSIHVGFSKHANRWAPILAFNQNNNTDSEKLLKNKIKIINYLLGREHEKITEENFDSFIETKEYFDLLKIINKFNTIYEKILSKYNELETQLIPYENYIQNEKKRKEDILQKKKNELFNEIFEKLPPIVKTAIGNKSLEEKQDAILGSMDISVNSSIESFRQEQMDKLKSDDVDHYTKYFIVLWQANYLKKLGIIIPNEKMLNCDTEEDITNYLTFLNQDYIKKYIPSYRLINDIISIRERKYEDALREYYTTRKDFTNIMELSGNDSNNLKPIYDAIKNKKVFIAGQGAIRDDNEFISIMFYTIRVFDGGYLFYSFMHEAGHIIDQSQKGCGFEPFDDLGENPSKNPYDNAYRKYERFNEILNDIFTNEALKILQDKGIYLIEPKEFTKADTSNNNTSLITKNLLQPLVQKFRKQVIKAKINAEPEELVKYIGKDNFEELVDSVNKIDYLIRNEVLDIIKVSPEDTLAIEYFEQIERVKQIYINIDNYYANNFEFSFVNDYEDSNKRK